MKWMVVMVKERRKEECKRYEKISSKIMKIKEEELLKDFKQKINLNIKIIVECKNKM
jgi:hypothetical protein